MTRPRPVTHLPCRNTPTYVLMVASRGPISVSGDNYGQPACRICALMRAVGR